jgi:hypothetical protein
MVQYDRNYRRRLPEFCDCYMETDPKKELEKAAKEISSDPAGDTDELAIKFLEVEIFHDGRRKRLEYF